VNEKYKNTKWVGAAALAGFLAHAAAHIARGTPEDILWMCNLAALLVAVGLLLGRARPLAVGVSWLLIGDVLWAIDVLAGGELLLTSPLTHLLGLAAGIFGIRKLGFPAATWPIAALGLIALQEACRWITPARSNVNVAFSLYAGAEMIFPSFWLYRATLLVLAAACFAVTEVGARKLLRPAISLVNAPSIPKT
jgi:hypothetical protein